ncbi:SMI1/KNR4 family protein [Ruminococcus flavefaciens]|uniref:SMI1/KNR4 family protein n=1 Tax=Ruminococcus flavefaciens TaxID=1265 RepID=UPI000687F35A|nr:SMI1/KNR4 family protein [Ruminococcus flavefaciens]
METYTGKMIFSEFFAFLNSQNPSRQFHEIAPEKIQNFLAQFPNIKLPSAYVEFMRYAGNGLFWVGSDYGFNEVPELKEWADELLEENCFPHKMKEDYFVFWMHQGYMFYFFKLSEGDDPPVYYYSECAQISDFVKCSDSFTHFIMKQFGFYRHESEMN